MLRSRRDQGGGRHRERRPRFASSSGPCAARPWSSRSSVRARIRLTARPEYVMPPFSSGHLRLAASRYEIHAVRDPVRAAFLFVGSSLFVRQCRMPKLCLCARGGPARARGVSRYRLDGELGGDPIVDRLAPGLVFRQVLPDRLQLGGRARPALPSRRASRSTGAPCRGCPPAPPPGPRRTGADSGSARAAAISRTRPAPPRDGRRRAACRRRARARAACAPG